MSGAGGNGTGGRRSRKLELTWIGKEDRPRLEPRILVEEPGLSHAAQARRDADLFDNRLIQGDNLLALKALEAEFTGRVKCIFIDPPYNTGSAFEHYDDGLEHSLWLSMIRNRLIILYDLMAKDGSIWITIDSNESAYLKVLCDEVFGRSCFVETISWRNSDSSNNNAKRISLDHNDILVYGKRPEWTPNFLDTPERRSHFRNPDNDPRGPWFDGNNLQNPAKRPNLQYGVASPSGHMIRHPPNGWRWSRETLDEKLASGEIRFTPDGRGLRRRTYLADMKGLPPSSFWFDLDRTGHNRQAKYELKNLFPDWAVTDLFGTPKPERLVHEVLSLATNPGDIVLDSFAGSGTTGAVAHKMGRRWIMVELGEHARTHIVPRLRKVIDGEDPGGITEAVGWKGGGGFRFERLAPSLLERDRWGNWVISRNYNPAMLAEAMCKHMGFAYAPSQDPLEYWRHGSSSERDFIFVTTHALTHKMLEAISYDVGPDRHLLVCCKAFNSARPDAFANLTLAKIPHAILSTCEWSRDDYSLRVANLSVAEAQPEGEEAVSTPSRTRRERAAASGPTLFDAPADVET